MDTQSPFDDGMSPAEREYINSRGSKIEELLKENNLPPATEDTTSAPAVSEPAEPAADDDEDEPEPKDQPGEKKQPPARVNYNKYKKLEEKAAQVEAELTKERERVARFDERFKLVQEALAAQQQQQETAEPVDEDPEPDKTQNIFEHNDWLSRQLAKERGRVDEIHRNWQAFEQEQVLQRNYLADAQNFMAKEPAFRAAYDYLLQSRLNEIAVQRPDLAKQENLSQLYKIVTDEERGMVADALANNRSPAEILWRYAQARGFDKQAFLRSQQQPGAAQTPQGAQSTTVPAGQAVGGTSAGPAATAPPPPAVSGGLAPPAAPAPSQQPSAIEQVQNISAGQAASRSLSNTGGSAVTEMTPGRLADMSDSEFEAFHNALMQAGKTRYKEFFGS